MEAAPTLNENTITFQIDGHIVVAMFTENKNNKVCAQVKKILLSTCADTNIPGINEPENVDKSPVL